MTNRQPRWKLAWNIGEINPADTLEDGKFVFVDMTGVYPPELEIWQAQNDWSGDDYPWKRYRLVCEPLYLDERVGLCNVCEKEYRPENPFNEWFAEKIESVSRTVGMEANDLIALLVNDDPAERAIGYDTLVCGLGVDEFDQYPVEFSARDARKKLKDYERRLKKRKD